MAICKQCKGKGYLVVKDDVRIHLTGRGKPSKTKTCYRCKGSGKVSKSGPGCISGILMVVGLILLVFVMASMYA